MKRFQAAIELSGNRYIAIGLLCASVCISVFVLVTYWNMRSTQYAAKKNEGALRSLRTLERVLDDMQDIETGQRGYIITKNKNFLDPYRKAHKKLASDTAELRALIEDDSAKLIPVNHLQALIHQNVTISEWLVRYRDTPGYSAATVVEKTAASKRAMDDIRNAIFALETRDRIVLNRSNIERQQQAEQTNNLFIALSLVFFTALAINFYVIRSNFRQQQVYQDRLHHMSSIVEQTAEAILTSDTNFTIQSWNKGAEEMYGYTAEETIGKPMADAVNSLIDDEERGHIRQTLATSGMWIGEIDQYSKSGSKITVLSSISPRRDVKGIVIGWIIVNRNITERKKLEAQIAHLSTLVEQTSDSIFSTDKNLIIKSWNHAAEKMYGYSAQEAIGRRLSNLIKSSLTDQQRQASLDDLDRNGFYRHEFEYVHKNGQPIIVFASVTALRNKKNEITGYVAVHRDISERKKLENELQQLNAQLENKVIAKTAEITTIFERINDAFVALDANWTYTYLSKKAGEIFRLDPKSLIGKNIWAEFPEGIGSKFYQAYHTAMHTQQYTQVQEYYPSPGIWLEYHIHPSPEGLSVFFRDITDAKQAQELIAKERDLSADIINTLPGLFYLYNTDGKFLRWNKNFETISGYSTEEIASMHPVDFFDDNEKDLLKEKIANVFKLGQDSVEANFLSKNGKKTPYFFTGLLTHFNGETCLMGSAIDISERKDAEENLTRSNAQLRELAMHLQNIREEERTSMAREIHDELGQQLTGLKMDISWLNKKLAGHDEKISAKMAGSLQLIDTTINTVRRLASDLRPSILDDLGLAEALEWQSREFTNRTGIAVKIALPGPDCQFSPDITTGLFRIFQESLTNVARHAKATRVDCSLAVEGNNVELTVADNGVGFQVDHIGDKKTLGLLGMKERIAILNGRYEISSQIGKGTIVSATVPLGTVTV